MSAAKYLLIGGGVASHYAAEEIRKKDSGGSITIVGEEPYLPYDRPPLSKEYMRGDKPLADMFFEPEDFYREKNIKTVLKTSVQNLDLQKRIATLSNNDSVTFDKALIATGGRPIKLKLPGADMPGVHYLRTIDDANAIAKEIGNGKRCVIIGAGFIGIEVAATLTQKGISVTVLEAESRIWPRFTDETLSLYFQNYCSEQGVIFDTSQTATEIRGKGRPSSVITKSGKEIPCDFVCIAVGIAPNAEIAQQAGLEVNNGVVVNEFMQTSNPNIYAAGDICNYPDPIFGRRRRVEHWGHAKYSGQVAGLNMAGTVTKYNMLSYVWSDIFDLHLEFAGDESTHDRVILRGKFEDKSFFALYLRDNVLTAYLSVNTSPREFVTLQRLIQRKKDLTGKDDVLMDPIGDIKSLLL